MSIVRTWCVGFFILVVVVGVAMFLRWSQISEKFSVAIGSSSGRTALMEESADRGVMIPQVRKPVRILFGGDMMFDRYIRTVARIKGNDFILSDVREILDGADLFVANLEGPITNSTSQSESSVMGEPANYVFTFDSSWAETLSRHNIGVVNIGNNHILNFSVKGLEETRGFLDSAGVGFFGDPMDAARRILVRDIGGITIGLVNYNQFVADGEAKAIEDVRAVRGQADIVVVYTHWGVEYAGATTEERRLGRAFIDAGADAVIGSHPHVIQETEMYQGKKIYYSLGNFVFDQYFRDDTRRGLLVEVTVDPVSHELSYRDISVELRNNGQTVISR